MTTYLLGAIVRLWARLSKGGIDKWERGRARSIAAASAPLHGDALPPEDRKLVEAHHEIVVEWRTAEQPAVDPLSPLCPLDRLWTLSAAVGEDTPLFAEVAATRADSIAGLFGADAPPALLPAVLLPLEEPVWEGVEGPTGVFPANWMDLALAKGRAR